MAHLPNKQERIKTLKQRGGALVTKKELPKRKTATSRRLASGLSAGVQRRRAEVSGLGRLADAFAKKQQGLHKAKFGNRVQPLTNLSGLKRKHFARLKANQAANKSIRFKRL